MTDRVLAIDGGNSKTAVALVDTDGRLLARVRGPGASPQNVGLARSLEVFDGLVREAARAAGLADGDAVAVHTAAYLAGADLPKEEEDLRVAIEARGWSATTVVGNDTFALLRAGTADGIGVAVVCGAGINCVAVAPDGRTHRFPALGRISGDWGGGGHIGSEALWHAVRAEDGRGEPTALLDAVRAHYGTPSVAEAVQRLHFEEVEFDPHALCPLLFEVAAGGDAVARSVVERLVEEVVVLARVSLTRLGLLDEAVDVVLGGGVLTGTGGVVVDAVAARLGEAAPAARVRVVDVPPVVGAALLGLDAVGASPGAESRLRAAYARDLNLTRSG
ncbi:N-acetylglucosamine kinase-like BadF-type ATPase [Saccharothrix saharensis]|uniref:N-acetylglucosamine kinase-like BadF-type ATPase n=1 Tax=Saccharothrix saharensis TaxID=571190 RepID=A0A543JFF7_9PSEU|nr:BadF/BadG/BcrA/BcrD ATPase family protein [Saccharothrix saharensis]TQM81526.1 N-acetylglucosamine kinase-like BadF-type ATPase [Saccharothrix saharensis]